MSLDLILPLFNPELLKNGVTQIKLGSNSDYYSKNETLDSYILEKIGIGVGYGGYLEKRKIYEMSRVFAAGELFRDIHLGIDFWCVAGTKVHAPANGVIHSFKDNNSFGDYGPTIIIEHSLNGGSIYVLYAHLSKDSLKNLYPGKQIFKGEVIAKIGKKIENIGWPPHLHFQLIKDLEENEGDYPGVCSEKDLTWFKMNCPDPITFLNSL